MYLEVHGGSYNWNHRGFKVQGVSNLGFIRV